MDDEKEPKWEEEDGVLAESGQSSDTEKDSNAESKAEFDYEKAVVIEDACKRGDIGVLKDLAVSRGGFLSDTIRCQAWPLLLGANALDHGDASPSGHEDGELKEKSITFKDGPKSWRKLQPHRDEAQVQLDVDRSFVYYPNEESEVQLKAKKLELSNLITEILRRHPYLCYFQGYHDICQVFLLVLPPPLRAPVMAKLSLLRIRDFMLPNLAPAVAQLRLIPDILNAVDPKLCRHLSQTEPFFALSGTLTMYAHDIQSYGDIARLFDALLAREQVFSVYMFAQIVLNRREELFDTPADEPEMLHSILSKLPHPLQLEDLIADTSRLFTEHPPETLRSWRRISSASVMKTARDVGTCAQQSLEDGHKFFDRQLKELVWAERRERALKTMWKYRQPASSVLLAVLIGVAAVYLRRSSSPGPWAYLTTFWSRWV